MVFAGRTFMVLMSEESLSIPASGLGMRIVGNTSPAVEKENRGQKKPN